MQNPPLPPVQEQQDGQSIHSRHSNSSARTLPRQQLSRPPSLLNQPMASASQRPLAVAPTRSHWKPDALALECDSPACVTQFSFLTRRHHCRRCGGVFCAVHAERQVPLDREAEFSEEANWWRACEGCYTEWVEGLSGGVGEGERHVREGMPIPGRRRNEGETGKRRSIVGSLSNKADWTWSTF